MVRRFLAIALVSTLGGGCGAVTLIHDAYLGPLSPAGRINPLVVGSSFRVGDEGPVAEVDENYARLRPLPPDLLERMSTARPLFKGLTFGVAGMSYVVRKLTRQGRILDAAATAALGRGISVSEVLRRLGTPSLWIKRRGGSIMTYDGEQTVRLFVFIGLPPGLSSLVAVPGIGSLTFRYETGHRRPRRTMLFFDSCDRLTGVAPWKP